MQVVIADTAEGTGDDLVGWGDVFVDDYLLVELAVLRVYDTPRTWSIQYKLLAATRIATTP